MTQVSELFNDVPKFLLSFRISTYRNVFVVQYGKCCHLSCIRTHLIILPRRNTDASGELIKEYDNKVYILSALSASVRKEDNAISRVN